MDPLRVALRCLVVYVVMLVATRVSGRRLLTQANPLDFALALIMGDLTDNAVWGEVPLPVFGAGVTSVLLVHVTIERWNWKAGAAR